MTIDASKLSEVLPHAERLPHTRFSLAIRRFFGSIARWISWIWLALIGVVVLNVTMRYLFSEGRIEFEEIQWHLYAIGFLVGLATCMDTDDHIRVDVFHERMSLQSRAWIELYGLLLLFFPFVISVLIFSVPFVAYSYASRRGIRCAGGLAVSLGNQKFPAIQYDLVVGRGRESIIKSRMPFVRLADTSRQRLKCRLTTFSP